MGAILSALGGNVTVGTVSLQDKAHLAVVLCGTLKLKDRARLGDHMAQLILDKNAQAHFPTPLARLESLFDEITAMKLVLRMITMALRVLTRIQLETMEMNKKYQEEVQGWNSELFFMLSDIGNGEAIAESVLASADRSTLDMLSLFQLEVTRLVEQEKATE